MGMKYLTNLSLKRFIAFNWALLILGTAAFASLIGFIAPPKQVNAQAAGYTYRNAGTIVNGNEVFYDRNITDSTREFVLAGTSPCSYATANRNNIARDRILVNGDGTSGSRFVIDPNKRDFTGAETCEATETKITISNPSSANNYTLYRSGDTVSSYNGSVSFNKTGTNGNAEIFVRNGESGVPCADIVVKDGSSWYIFPMAPKTADFGDEEGTAVSERYDGYINGGGGSKENCRVRSIEIETPFQLDKRIQSNVTGPDQGCRPVGNEIICEEDGYARTGIDGNLYAYANFVVPAGWGDDGYQIMKGVGTNDNGPPPNAPPPTPGTTEDGDLTPTTCDVAFSVVDIISLKWIICPLLDGLSAIVGLVNDLLNSQLRFDTSPLQDGSPYHLAQNAFRVLALGLIIVAALIMVVAQATGIELLSAYTIKKLASRLVIIILLISLSWPLGKVIIGLINDLGQGLASIVLTPFSNIPREQLGGGSSFSLALLGTGAILFLGPLGLLSLLATAALVVASAVFILGIVHAIGFLLLILMPLIIATFALENTKGLGKFGAGAATGVAMILIATPPIIAGVRAAALTTYNLGGTINQIIGTVLELLAPLLVTAIAIKVGGNITGLLTGIQDKFNAGSRALSKFRGSQISKNAGKMAAGNRFNRDYLGFNTMTKGAAAWWNADNKSAFLSLNKSRRQAARNAAVEQHENILAARYGKTEKAQVAQHNDGLLQAQTYASEAEARMMMKDDWGYENQADVDKAIAAAKINGGWGRQQQINATRRLFATGTGYNNLRQVHDTVARVAGKNDQLAAALLGEGNATTKGVGRHDLAAGFGTHMELYNQRMTQGHSLTAAQVHMGVAAAAKDTDAVTMGRDKGVAVENFAPVIAAELQRQRAIIEGSTNKAEVAAAQAEAVKLNGMIETLQQSGSYFSGNNVERLARDLGTPTLDVRAAVQDDVKQAGQRYVTETVQVQVPSPGGGTTTQTIERPVVVSQDANGNVIYQENTRYDDSRKLPEASRWHSPQRGLPYNRDNDPRLN